MDKKLHALRARFYDNGNAIYLQKISDETVQLTSEKANKERFVMNLTVTQLREAINNIDLWDKKEVVKDEA